MKNFKRVFLFLTVLILSVQSSIYAKDRGKREYYFDLYNSRKQISFVPSGDAYVCTINLPTMKIGYPQQGDIIHVYWNADVKKQNSEPIKAKILFKDQNVTSTVVSIETTDFSGGMSFITPMNVINPISIFFYYSEKENHNNELHFHQCYTGPAFIEEEMEIPEEVKIIEAEKTIQNVQIIEETENGDVNILTDLEAEKEKEEAELKAKLAEEKRLAEEAAEKERLLAEEKARIAEEERLAKEAEEKRLAAIAAEEALKATEISRYKKENLLDYQKKENLQVSEQSEGSEPVSNPDEKDFFGQTLLMKAAKAGNDWQIKQLLEAGADVNLKDNDGWTALMYAARYQENKSTIELLINAGAEIMAANKYEYTALSIAGAYNDNPDITKMLLKYFKSTDKETLKAFTLMLSNSSISESVQLAKFQVFLDKSVPVNSFYAGKTPLMYAAQYGNSTKILKALMDNGALTKTRSSEGKTAFEYASANSRLNHDDYYWELNKR